MLETYPKEVKLVFKHFPLGNHQFARPAAVATMSAHKQGKFWEFHDTLFENYSQLSDEKIRQIAVDLGLDMAKYEAGLKDPGVQSAVSRDMQDGLEIGVRGTPSLYVNGKPLRNRSLAGFQEVIDAALGR